MKESRLYESVKYHFSKDEIHDLGEALARENQTVYDHRARKKAVVAELTAQIEQAEARASDLTTKINNGYELREVECMVLMETPRPGMKRIVRIDTNEHLRDEPMTAQEMQSSFGFSEGPAGSE